jgi:peptidoglycan glycosyltransferase
MKQLKHRTLFVLLFALLLTLGTVIFCVLCAMRGQTWASSSVNQRAYAGGSLSSGTILDRNGTLLYDCESKSYGDSALLRAATLHLVGDRQGNIATGAKKLFSKYLVGYNPITGLGENGNDLYLSIDADLNKLAYQALDGRAGVVAVYNYKTGEILCLVTSPSYDPDSESQVSAVAAGDSAYAGAYLNRFFSSTYTPGSVFKIVTAAAALENLDTDHFTFECTGSMAIGGDKVTCPSAHGSLDFASALANSCNCAFAQLALELGGETLETYCQEAGLLDSLDISGYSSASGSFEVAEDGSLQLGWSGVGQFNDLICPANMLNLMGCIANGGSAKTPRLVSKVTGSFGLPAALISSPTSSIGWESSTCAKLVELMRNNVIETYGQSKFGDLTVCAKSGTAEVGSDVSPHAWFTGFLTDSDYPYAFVVVVEHGGGGAKVAGGIAASVLLAACGEG